MRGLAIATLLVAACSTPTPACADGQQNPCACGELGGVQTCNAGKYSDCDCSAAQKAIDEADAALDAEADAEAKAVADKLQSLKDERDKLQGAMTSLDKKLSDAKEQWEKDKLLAEKEALQEQLDANAEKRKAVHPVTAPRK